MNTHIRTKTWKRWYYEDETVGPYHNRQETYSYFSLPFCVGPKEKISHYHETLGEALQGVELEFSGLDIDFKTDVAKTVYCEVELDEVRLKTFVYAVKNHYWYQMYIDDLPIWGIVGEIDEANDAYYIWTHKKFDLGYNGNQIVDVNLTSESRQKLELGPRLNSPMRSTGRSPGSSLKTASTSTLIQISSSIGFTGSAFSTLS
ncbi:putative transmembrane 9 superfamily member 3-like [Penaeus vannamei]|uniref:Transmembrane 9 superfamily member n=1 Tax=Penaeus vannamei TaxID=6689 RepID=A0A423SKM6_PENVA|nr:putative transmembrane 9 superfamily member 3-like [Penaeus vannamei]